MERRFESRYPANLEVWVTDLQNDGHSACAAIHDISESGVCVVTPLQLAPGAIVRIDAADSSLFGFVTYAIVEDSGWRAGIEIQRVLVGVSDLSVLLQQVLLEAMPQIAVGPRV